MYYVYILYSPDHDRYYIGQTQDLNSRLERHQKGYVKSTKHYLPVQLVWSKAVESRSQAVILESKIKNWKSKGKIRALIKESK